VDFPAFPLFDVETVLSRLPAEARARVSWAKSPIKKGLARLRTEPLTDELVAQVGDAAWRPLISLGLVFWETVATNLNEWRARFVDDFRQEEEFLAAFVDEDEARDTLRWILGLLQSYLSLSLSIPSEFLSGLDEAQFARLGDDEDFKPYARGLVALMAAVETGRADGEPQRARDLLDVAFLALNAFRATVLRHGISLSPFPSETIEERRRVLLESADRLRTMLTDEDWRVLEQARMHDLR
jgi:hypothetical protein